jgi:hypothetical protein
MRSLIGAKQADEFAAALRESESVRMECQAIRAELEEHRHSHGTFEKSRG